ncbi:MULTISPECIES: cupin domain-containing protein [Flavobacterium]|uniref:Cupin domain-containing protein n=2 Tax=Flavobacterium TaxID=237 RepID=A0A940X6I4_9FLAO|nr:MULTISPECIES: cupin domain-containing protein [Flavobacterium]MBP4139023.1 cupin domain-containing protein [Flavobacterium geliluteum]MDX6181447.1 cupin domain-containing protein [Flavobacterium sp. Fl-33]MDX6185519.1 cupin domain-containing protein [Flavobacterium sp. Fl-77]UFH37622.1 cupin domain-containing protein [Flavobacterium sp. F-70]
MPTPYTISIEEGKIPNTYMTGDVTYKKQTSTIHPENTIIKEVAFEPGARCNWHINASLQLLIATDGIGYFQEKGAAIRLLHKDEVVTILPGVEHWYGATPFSRFAQISIITEIDKGKGIWLESVSDDEYYNFGK